MSVDIRAELAPQRPRTAAEERLRQGLEAAFKKLEQHQHCDDGECCQQQLTTSREGGDDSGTSEDISA